MRIMSSAWKETDKDRWVIDSPAGRTATDGAQMGWQRVAVLSPDVSHSSQSLALASKATAAIASIFGDIA